jgi:regulator of PEP synthase PpsR (kinase-PPPase family)
MDNSEKKQPVVFVVSDSLGETADFVARAAASQFDGGNVEIRRIPYVADKEDIEEIFKEALNYNSIITYTVVIRELREMIESLSRRKRYLALTSLGRL